MKWRQKSIGSPAIPRGRIGFEIPESFLSKFLSKLRLRGAMFRGAKFRGSNVPKCKVPGSKVPGSKFREQNSGEQNSGHRS